MQEPLEEYSRHFQEAREIVEDLLESSIDLVSLETNATTYLLDADVRTAVRYLTGPPISEADLKTVAEVRLSATAFRNDPEASTRAIDIIRLGLDSNRFPWVSEGREPTEAERAAAVISTSALMAARKVLTARANESKGAQEQMVKDALLAAKFTEVHTRRIPTLVQAPNRGEFCGESEFGSRKADIIVRLWDDRVLALECKVSNSSTNSVKRLNNDAAAKATAWINEFGTRQVVPGAMLGGVFKLKNLVDAQAAGLSIWWAHDLETLTEWIEGTRVP
ncbi:XamI family restriction endonuclease [Cryobacterium sp. GrIS_2_6]|uniref:XamI family restriction endonuclease n=1 Tax=Cryobacterium sp. GrIS_2_6 TaxID=3162785 RepID=UPI002E0C7FBF|nr:XamI family restriction endonuclease [Cryobacterium psychrotolerans]MEC5149522.1 hypothetical protein [Cryobacterium psychrotolerans]